MDVQFMPSGDFKIKKVNKIIQPMSTPWKCTSALNKGGWSSKRTGRFTPGKEPPVPVKQEVQWAGRIRKLKNSRPCWNSNPGSSGPWRSLYNYNDIPAPINKKLTQVSQMI